MPSVAIHTTSVTCCRPPPRFVVGDVADRKPQRDERAEQRQRSRQAPRPRRRVPPPVSSPRRRPRRADQRAEQAAGGGEPDQDREGGGIRSALQQEVEADAGRRRARAARRSSARSRSARRARRPSRRARCRSCRRRGSSSTNTRSKVSLREAPDRAPSGARRAVDQLVEVPLVDEQRRTAARSARAIAAGVPAPARDPDAVGDRDAGERRARVPRIRPITSSAVFGVRFIQRRVRERRAQEVVDHEVDFRDLRRARRRPRRARAAPIAMRIGHARSAIAWSGPGKPTSVSSISPLAGLVGCSAWCRWPCFDSSRASGTGSPWKARKIIRKV